MYIQVSFRGCQQYKLHFIYWCRSVLGGSWDLVSKVISTLIGVISNYKYSYLSYNPTC